MCCVLNIADLLKVSAEQQQAWRLLRKFTAVAIVPQVGADAAHTLVGESPARRALWISFALRLGCLKASCT